MSCLVVPVHEQLVISTCLIDGLRSDGLSLGSPSRCGCNEVWLRHIIPCR